MELRRKRNYINILYGNWKIIRPRDFQREIFFVTERLPHQGNRLHSHRINSKFSNGWIIEDLIILLAILVLKLQIVNEKKKSTFSRELVIAVDGCSGINRWRKRRIAKISYVSVFPGGPIEKERKKKKLANLLKKKNNSEYLMVTEKKKKWKQQIGIRYQVVFSKSK